MNIFEIKEAMSMALAAIKAHKMRAFLTVLGVLIGVTTVIAMVSIITGLNKSMSQQIESLGSNIIWVTRFEIGIRFEGPTEEERNRPPITFEDAMAVAELCPSVDAVSPQNWGPGSKTVKYKDNKVSRFELIGIMPSYEVVNNNYAEEGRFFTDSDVNYRAMVAVLGRDVADVLFPNLDPIGREISIAGRNFAPRRFTVIGVMEERPSILGDSQNNFVLLPHPTYKKLYPEEKELLLVAKPESPEVIDQAIEEITQVMRIRRGLSADKPNNFAIATQDDLMDMYRNITKAIYMVMVVISSIGLLVGGVGVMNIMLVSVTERTREIGVRKAIGARKKDILWQFLIEAMTLSGSGGILGIIIGLLLGEFVAAVSPLPAGVSLFWIVLGFSFAVSVGLIFGIYPAYRAARLDPIVSLRYE
ncbi:MAG: FtsX-like permease family protein [candidate division Zixibacteria bacterium]|nr:FtsX-like permease family protein [candidate division Zixibacteria bacterium]